MLTINVPMPPGHQAEEQDGAEDQLRNYVITEAKIKDDFCHYSFKTIRGLGVGEEHSVKIDNIITDDMKDAFSRLNVHLAVIDDVFKHADVEIDDIDTLHNDSLTLLYHVHAFKITGSEGDESIILMGSKYLHTAGGRMDIKTPKIPLDNLSSYPWYNELKTAADAARLEVARYKEGKYENQPEGEEQQPDPRQLTIGDQLDGNSGDDDDDFEEAKL